MPSREFYTGLAVKIPQEISQRVLQMATGSAIARIFGMTRVLMVEDSEDVLYVLQIELEWMGYKVEATTNATAALAAAQCARPDVIVSDLGMPGIDGFEFIRRIRKIPDLASVPAIALTGTSMDKDVQQALAYGFTAHLIKPVEAIQLGKRIEQLTSRWLERRAS